MRFYLFLIFLFSPVLGFCQFTEDFTDGDFTNNPVWSGDDSVFTIINVSGNNQLRSNKQIASTSFYLSTPSVQANDCQWEFYVNLQFNTSSANYVDVYLTSNNANLLAGTNSGYFVRIGNTSDEISLYSKVSGTETEIIDGFDAVTNISNSTLKIKATRTASNVWTLDRDVTGTGSNYVNEGSVTDATVLTGGFFGVLIKQSTASFFNKHFFDDFNAGPIVTDVTAPAINSVTVISSTQLDILFSEPVETNSSQLTTNYNVDNGIGNPSSAVRDAVNLSLVHLTFPTAFVSGLSNQLSVSNVEDLAGNAVTTASSNFTYTATVSAAFKDIIFNEIFADPSPQIALPTGEFVELYNRSSNAINLNGWKFTDGTSTATLGSFVLQPNSYLIICPTADVSSYTSFGSVLGVSSFPSLNNTSDNLQLKDNNLTVIDSVSYSDTWYRDAVKDDGGWTLELINPNAPIFCAASTNWIASNNSSGGTPGTQNSVYSLAVDVTAPSVLSVTAIDAIHVTVCFSEPLDVSQLNNIGNYNINKGIGNPIAANGLTGSTCVDLTLGSALSSDTTYSITFSNLSDCSGNQLTNPIASFSFYVAKAYDIVINEIMADFSPVVGLPAYEYVELYNRKSVPIDITNWTFSVGTTIKTLPYAVIPANGFIILTHTAGVALLQAFGQTLGVFTSTTTLTDDGSTLILKDANGQIISTVAYSSSWYQNSSKSDGGYSLEQISPNSPCIGSTNWRASDNSSGGTPGSQNSVFSNVSDVEAPRLLRVSIINKDTIRLFFNESLDFNSLSNVSNYTIDNGVGEPVFAEPVGPDYTSVILAMPSSLQASVVYNITVEGQVKDCIGNLITTSNFSKFALPETAAFLDVVINEVLSNPFDDGVDFIEIYNRSQKVIDLRDITIASWDTTKTVPTKKLVIAPEGYLLFPSEYLILSDNSDIIKSQYTVKNEDAFYQMSSFPSYSISAGTVVLNGKNNLKIDSLTYYESWHFPLLRETKGVSLERINFNRATQERTNWHSAAEDIGFATPGYLNSQFSEDIESDTELKIEPEIFSPDNDGFNDVVNIIYLMSEPGFVASLSIFDSKGRLIKILKQNELLGISGVFTWDGTTNDNQKARMGIYIIFFEAFNSAGTVRTIKKTCVVAGNFN